jgi:hypothetical protein
MVATHAPCAGAGVVAATLPLLAPAPAFSLAVVPCVYGINGSKVYVDTRRPRGLMRGLKAHELTTAPQISRNATRRSRVLRERSNPGNATGVL